MTRALGVCLALLMGLGLVAPANAAKHGDTYLEGYADAVVRHVLDNPNAKVWAKGGVFVVDPTGLSAKDRETLATKLGDVATVRFAETGEEERRQGIGWFPDSELYDAPVADQRWPHFFASYQSFKGDPDVQSAGAVGFGESFGLYRWGLGPKDDDGNSALIQLGMQFGVFGLFDLNSASHDLINADYFIGPYLSVRDASKRNAAMLRLYHQSSHLGDEYLLRSRRIRESRLNVSYEAINLLAAHTVPLAAGSDPNDEHIRIYGGGQFIVHRDPNWLKRWSAQAGADYVGREVSTLLGERFAASAFEARPVAGLDIQSHEQVDWAPDVSLRAGVQFATKGQSGRHLRLMAEYYQGHSPHGQFFQREIEYLGFGAHLDF